MMKLRLVLLLVFATIVKISLQKSQTLIVLPPFFNLNEYNNITIVNDKNLRTELTIVNVGGRSEHLTFEDATFKQKQFKPTSQGNVTITIKVNGEVELQKVVPVRPDLFNVHIHIDKTVYRKAETVNARILPLTHSGQIYRGDLNIFLVNDEGFVETATMRTKKVDDENPIISEQLEVPFHTFFGDWKLVVQAVNAEKDLQEEMTFEKDFEVQDYDLPNFRLSGFLHDSEKIESTKITLEAKYFHGKPISGSVYVYCKDVGSDSLNRSHLISVKSGEFEGGFWSQEVNLTKCNPFGSTPKEILIEARENGTGQRQDLTLNWDLNSPKIKIVAVRPYFTKDTSYILLMIDGDGLQHGEVNVTIRCIDNDRDGFETRFLEKKTKVGSVLKFDVPPEWREKNVPVMRIEAKRKISHGWSNVTMLYIPNLDNTPLGTTIINPIDLKMYYKEGDIMEVTVKKDSYSANKMHYIIVCNQNTIHHVPSEVRENVLRVKIDNKMEGTCILAAYSPSEKTAADVMLFRVQNSCEDCSLKLSKVENEEKSIPLSPSDFVEPGDDVSLEFTGEPGAIVFYRAMDERLNYIASKGISNVPELLDYIILNNNSHSAQVLNFVNRTEVESVMKARCVRAGERLRLKCEQGAESDSHFSKKCLRDIIHECHKKREVKPEAIQFEKGNSKTKTASVWPNEEYNDPGTVKKVVKLRHHFPETWLFDAVVLAKNGSKKIVSRSPDNVGQWALSSAFWRNGKASLFIPNTTYLTSRKSVFLEINIPRNVYVNETISPLLTVSGVEIKKKETYVICLADLSRNVCADQGSNGKKGDPYYFKIELTPSAPVQSKYLMWKFLTQGEVNITVMLREKNCKDGKILDAVRQRVDVQKRADTEEYFGEHTIIPNKPIISTLKEDKMITFSDQRASEDDSDTINTLISSNIPDTETVYSFRISLTANKDISKQTILNFGRRRIKRNGQRRLTSVIRDLAVSLYSFKTAKLSGYTSNELEYEIDDLVNEMMSFSNCTGKSDPRQPCGYNEFRRPEDSGSFSIVLTSIATSLLCEAGVEDNRVKGSLLSIFNYIPNLHQNLFEEDLSDLIDIENIEDKKFLIVSFMNQVSRDCAAYKTDLKDMSKAFRKLHKYFYDLDEAALTDGRTAGAIALMATNSTAEIMRSEILSRIDTRNVPYWHCDVADVNKSKKHIQSQEGFRRRRESCAIMVNSFGLAAVVTAYAEGNEIDWDKLADWISEQRSADGSYGSPLNTLVATRSVYEKRRRNMNIDYNQNLQVTVRCKECVETSYNVTEHPVEIHIPTNVRYVTLTSAGKGKAKVTARIVATKRQRPKRGLTQDDYYPVNISINQYVEKNFVHQIVCMNVTNPTIKSLDLFHGFYTLYHTTTEKLNVLNSTYYPINPAVSSLGMHFYLADIAVNETICYELVQTEIEGGKNYPSMSAPVPIRAVHPVFGLVGMILISHPDVQMFNQKRRKKRESARTRFVRGIIDTSAVDVVCYEKGECSCAETTCSVQCQQCASDTLEKIGQQISKPGYFGIRIAVESVSNATVNGAAYKTFDGTILDSTGSGADPYFKSIKMIRVWLRACNYNCIPKTSSSSVFFVIGHKDGLNLSDGRYNYVLNHEDRFEESKIECQELNTKITIK